MADNQLYRDASDRLTFEMFRVPSDSYCAVRDALVDMFRLVPDNALVTNGFDVVFQEFRRGELVVGLEWDNWSGFIVTAKTPESEPLVREIAGWLLESLCANLYRTEPQ